MHRAFLNVGYILSEKQLRAHFAQFGLVSDTYLPKHTSGRNKGFGFVTFDSAQALDRALLTPAHLISGVTVQVLKPWTTWTVVWQGDTHRQQGASSGAALCRSSGPAHGHLRPKK